MNTQVLSKSKLMRGWQCSKNLWLTCFKPDLEPKPDMATQLQFSEGNEVGELARKQAGTGILIDIANSDYEKANQKTQEAVEAGAELIFEGSFFKNNLFARADILQKDQQGWHLIEVKKSSSVKKHHLLDSAIQAYIIESTGLSLSSVSIRYINNSVTYPNISNIFSTEDITDQVREILNDNFALKIEALKQSLESDTEPEMEIGPHCDYPFSCPFKTHCWKGVQDKSVFDLPNLFAKKKWELYVAGKKRITDLDPTEFHGLTKRAIISTKENKIFIDKVTISKKLSEWKFPLYFFDFETIGPAIPRYVDSKPYDQIPFQFSCHVWSHLEDSHLEHFEYLHTESSDPRPALIRAMLDGLKEQGSIVAYNKAFEVGVIKKLARFDSENKKRLLALNERFVDPLPLIKETVYHPDFLGKFSIKYVAPALIGDQLSYENLIIGDGGAAQSVANQLLQGNIKPENKEKTIQSLLEYCRQDTMAMVELVRWLLK